MITAKRMSRIKAVVSARRNDVVVVLEDIHDPHNAAAILRSCDAFGIQHVYFIFDKTKPYNPKRVGKVSSSSANKWLTYHIFRDTVSCFDELKKDGYMITATQLNSEATALDSLDFSHQKVALVLGNEHTGISQTATQKADCLVYLPMRGFVESLNVSVCAAICMYEVVRQKQSNKRLGLTEPEREALVEDFLQR